MPAFAASSSKNGVKPLMVSWKCFKTQEALEGAVFCSEWEERKREKGEESVIQECRHGMHLDLTGFSCPTRQRDPAAHAALHRTAKKGKNIPGILCYIGILNMGNVEYSYISVVGYIVLRFGFSWPVFPGVPSNFDG